MEKIKRQKLLLIFMVLALQFQAGAQEPVLNEKDIFNLTRTVKPKINQTPKPAQTVQQYVNSQIPKSTNTKPVVKQTITSTNVKPITTTKALVKQTSRTTSQKQSAIVKPAATTKVKTTITSKPAQTVSTTAVTLPAKKSTMADSVYNKFSSLNEVISKYPDTYDNTYIATLSGLISSGMKINFYDSESGMITGTQANKMLMIFVVPLDKTTTMVRITPADGVYPLSQTQTYLIFANIKNSFSLNPPANKN